MKNDALIMESIAKSYGPAAVLRDLSLSIPEGSVSAIMGRSGSGKSTLLNIIGGMDVPDAGSVRVFGQDLAAMNDAELTEYRRTTVGFIFQFFNLLPNISVLENVRMPLLLAGKDDPSVARSLIDRVGLGGREDAKPYELSGGEQQRVAIARALVGSPRLILADEPTGSLDAATGDVILPLIHDMATELGTTLILVTHDADVAAGAERVFEMVDGRIVNAERV